MKRKVLNSLAAVGTVVVAGCALDQAPLVYSSRMSAGVDITTNASESPGVSINIGVKTVDAAYVPVAVARRPGDAASAPADVIKILAQYGQGRSGRDGGALSEEDRARLDAYVLARQQEDDATEELRKAAERLKTSEDKEIRFRKALLEIDKAQAMPSAAASAAAAAWPEGVHRAMHSAGEDVLDKLLGKPSDLGAAKVALTGLRDRNQTQGQELQAAKRVAEQTLKERKAVSEQRLAQAAEAADLLQTSKSDAMSVFGSFGNNASADGAASTPSATATLRTRKVFSTGLASQNLTEAVKLSTVTDCMAQVASMVSSVAAASAASGVSGDQLKAIAEVSSKACGALASAR